MSKQGERPWDVPRVLEGGVAPRSLLASPNPKNLTVTNNSIPSETGKLASDNSPGNSLFTA